MLVSIHNMLASGAAFVSEANENEKSIEQARKEQNKTRRQAKARITSAADKKAKAVKGREKVAKKAAKATSKKAGAAQSDRDAKARATGAKQKGRFRPMGPARTATGDKKVDKVPAQLGHCMLALRFKRRKSTKAAWNICRWSLTKHGYLKPPYTEKGTIDKGATRQTRKGVRRSMQHSQEKEPLGGGIKGGGSRKYDKFSRMFKAIEKDV